MSDLIFERGTIVQNREPLDYSGGCGDVWPVGTRFRIQGIHKTSNGWRYSANAITPEGLVYVYPIPPEMLEVSDA